MPTPVIAGHEPAEVELVPEQPYFWCSCGRSARQPFCDGTHKDTYEFRSMRFEVAQPCRRALCMCKRTGTPPFCDGTHRGLGEEGPDAGP